MWTKPDVRFSLEEPEGVMIRLSVRKMLLPPQLQGPGVLTQLVLSHWDFMQTSHSRDQLQKQTGTS